MKHKIWIFFVKYFTSHQPATVTMIDSQMDKIECGWISVEERLPEKDQWVNIYTETWHPRIDTFQWDSEELWWSRPWLWVGKKYATHWIPLPPNP